MLELPNFVLDIFKCPKVPKIARFYWLFAIFFCWNSSKFQILRNMFYLFPKNETFFGNCDLRIITLKPGYKYACFKIQHLFPTRQRKIVNHSNVFNPCTFLHTFLKLLIFTWFLGEEGTKGEWFMTLPYFNSCLHSMIEDALDFLCFLVASASGEKSKLYFIFLSADLLIKMTT